tara:strand:+ start:9490 stop:9969 length:480 start_codon:yes stop_codon:yes gene_type:complete
MPEPKLRCDSSLWLAGVAELARRGGGRRESGAFLLGDKDACGIRAIRRFVFYDDLEPDCLSSGAVVFQGHGYGPLWKDCRRSSLTVVADVHTHPFLPYQSDLDRRHPMVAVAGHIGLIVPDLARGSSGPEVLGIYEYIGAHKWHDRSHTGFFILEEVNE